jgi:hypothetical protein
MAVDWKKEYESGRVVGAYADPRADEMLTDAVIRGGGDIHGTDVARTWGLEEAGKGKLTATWDQVMRVWPDCWPGPAQKNGSCVSFGASRASLTSLTLDILSGQPDEVTGLVEGRPDIPDAGIRNGVVSSEALFWWRGHRGDGWNCSEAANRLMGDAGIWLRKPYPELKLDLTEYDGDLEMKWGSPLPPEPIARVGRQHQIRTATVLEDTNQIRDFLAGGYGVFFCSNVAWSDVRDENGVSLPTFGAWPHSQFCAGWDERPEIIRIYKEPLCLVGNSWGRRWNRGPRQVRGTDLSIPEGFYWTPSSVMARGRCIALSGTNGWAKKPLPDYGATGRT